MRFHKSNIPGSEATSGAWILCEVSGHSAGNGKLLNRNNCLENHKHSPQVSMIAVVRELTLCGKGIETNGLSSTTTIVTTILLQREDWF